MAKKVKLKKHTKIGLILFLFLIVSSIVGYKFYQEYKYHQTYEYKLLEIEYKLEDTKILIENLNNNQLDNILTRDASKNIVALVQEKYFLYKNLDRYLDYLAKNKDLKFNDIVALINVNRDREFYEEPIATDTAKGILMLVNKYHNLTEDYQAENIIKLPDLSDYAYAGNSLNEEAFNAFKELANEGKTAGYTIILSSSYRTFKYQDELWNSYKATSTQKKADQYAARAGHSEHQTGYAIDVADFYDMNDKFGETKAFEWMIENSYKFGYILRYPKDKENLTGYAYEPWHYRYVGKIEAEKIYREQITFDEYYAFYLEK